MSNLATQNLEASKDLQSSTNSLIEKSLTATESRALELLSQGIPNEMVASAVGVEPSRISQLLGDPWFAKRLAELKYKTLAKHTERDAAYDKLEDKLVQRLDDMLPMMFKPGEVLKALQVVNTAKRRGTTGVGEVSTQQEVVTLNMPTQIIQHFTTNVHNQVIQAGEQSLVTVQSGNLAKMLEAKKHVPSTVPIAAKNDG